MEANKRVDRIVEEFRRSAVCVCHDLLLCNVLLFFHLFVFICFLKVFICLSLSVRFKVRTEISKKQRDAEVRASNANSSATSSSSSSPPPSSSSSSSAASASEAVEEAHRWREAYERVVREKEVQLVRGGGVGGGGGDAEGGGGGEGIGMGRGGGGEGTAFLLQQWQQRFDECQREKEELLDKLKIYSKMHHDNSVSASVSAAGVGAGGAGGGGGGGGGSVGGTQKSVEQAFIDLKDEYKVTVSLSSLFLSCSLTILFLSLLVL